MTPQNEKLLNLYSWYSEIHRDTIQTLDGIESVCKASPSAGPAVDTIFMLKKISALAEAMRLDIGRALEITMKIGCLYAMQSADNKITGEIAQGYGNTTQDYCVPDKERQPEEYRAFMLGLGLDEAVINNPLIKPSFKAISEFVSERSRNGLDLTPGMEHGKIISRFKVNVRAKAGIDLDTLAKLNDSPF